MKGLKTEKRKAGSLYSSVARCLVAIAFVIVIIGQAQSAATGSIAKTHYEGGNAAQYSPKMLGLFSPANPANLPSAYGTSSLANTSSLFSTSCDMSLQGRIMSYYCNQNSAPMRDRNYVQNCCQNNDGKCYLACNATNDNDCVIVQKLEQAHKYLLANKSLLGYTPAPNEVDLYPKTEVYRIIPGSQAIGYFNLYKATGKRAYLKEGQDRLNYIANAIATRPYDVWKNDSFDGFLGYAFLKGAEYGCDQNYKNIGLGVADRCLQYRDLFNWGLMCGLNLAEAYKLTGNSAYLNEAQAIVSRTAYFQNDDGSFPHQLSEKNLLRNRGYTAWMGFELVDYKSYDPAADSLIDINKTANLLEFLTDENGVPTYTYYCPETSPKIPCSASATPCESRTVFSCQPAVSGCTLDPDEGACTGTANSCPTFTNSKMCNSNGCNWHCAEGPSGCIWQCDKLVSFYDEENPDYETKGGTGELASSAVVFSKTGRLSAAQKTFNYLLSQQNPDYSFNPKWGYPSPPSQTSRWETPVVATSDVFFQLSEILRVPDSSR